MSISNTAMIRLLELGSILLRTEYEVRQPEKKPKNKLRLSPTELKKLLEKAWEDSVAAYKQFSKLM